ncbi:unnamed protein product [Closterium sp. Yama58-4]|nr:unnamed protein product [Closterium sp. Yama58-4]
MAIIHQTLATYQLQEVAFSFNGGKDSTVILHLLRAALAQKSQVLPRSSSSPGLQLQHAASHLPLSKSLSKVASFGISPRQPPVRGADGLCAIYFRDRDSFPEIDSFTLHMAQKYKLDLVETGDSFKEGLGALQQQRPVKAIFLGVRSIDPNGKGQEVFSASSPGWPEFMRVNVILHWTYRDVWEFLLLTRVPYCCLYDQGYTSIGGVHDTLPNHAVRVSDAAHWMASASQPPALCPSLWLLACRQMSLARTCTCCCCSRTPPASAPLSAPTPAAEPLALPRTPIGGTYLPAYFLVDEGLERAGRGKRAGDDSSAREQQRALEKAGGGREAGGAEKEPLEGLAGVQKAVVQGGATRCGGRKGVAWGALVVA